MRHCGNVHRSCVLPSQQVRYKFSSLSAIASDNAITDLNPSTSSLSSTATTTTTVSINNYDATSKDLIDNEIRRALQKAYPLDKSIQHTNTMLFQGKSEFGEYQCNIAMPLSKTLKQKPRDIAEAIMCNMNVDDATGGGTRSIIGSMDISGPGFINIHLSPYYIKQSLYKMLLPVELTANDNNNSSNDDDDSQSSSSSSSRKNLVSFDRVGIPKVTRPQRIVVDFSSPNIAKEMHVVSIRSRMIVGMVMMT